MKRTYLSIVISAVLICPSLFAASADNTEPDRDYRRATIKPTLVRLEPRQQQKFKIVLSAPYLRPAYIAEKVKWSVKKSNGP
jgi:P pilus assembly chaperone PapD